MSHRCSTHHCDVLVGVASTFQQLTRLSFHLSVQMMAGDSSYSIVEYFGGDDGYRCGYCKNEKGNFSHGKFSLKELGDTAGLCLK